MKKLNSTQLGGRPNGRWRMVAFAALLFVFGISTGATAQDFLPADEAKTLVSQEARTVMVELDQAHKSGDAQEVATAYAKRTFLANAMRGLNAGLATSAAYQEAVTALEGGASSSASTGFSLQPLGSGGASSAPSLSENSEAALKAEMLDLFTN